MLNPSSKSNDKITAAVTLPPTIEITRTSTLSPSAAIEIMVRMDAVVITGAIAKSGTRLNDRNVASTRNPRMNQGTNPGGWRER